MQNKTIKFARTGSSFYSAKDFINTYNVLHRLKVVHHFKVVDLSEILAKMSILIYEGIYLKPKYLYFIGVQYWYVHDLVNALDRLLRLRKENRNHYFPSHLDQKTTALCTSARSHDTPIECNIFLILLCNKYF